YSSGADEGRAMARLVHDLAPAAAMSFRTAFVSMSSFADNITKLRTDDGADVIVDAVFYFAEPAFQHGPIAVAAEAAVAAGVPYFTAVGNEDEVVGGKPVGGYQAEAFRPAPCPTSVATAYPGAL